MKAVRWEDTKREIRALHRGWDAPDRLAERERSRAEMRAEQRGYQLAQLRKNTGLTQAQVTAIMGVTQQKCTFRSVVSGSGRRSGTRADKESYITLDEGLSVISKHAREVLGYDAVVLLLDELVLWLAGYLADQVKVSNEAQKVSKLIESAEYERPAPIISFVPRQRDLRDLVSRDAVGAVATSLFDTLKYWDGRFDSIRLDDRNLPAIVHERG
jgi:transcriptional regulator with XRE-family HTH domain